MGIVDNALIGASGNQGYNLQRSLRFRSSASAYLNRTFTSTGNRQIWTWSGWVKRGALSSGALFGADGSNYMFMYFSPDSLDCGEVVGSQQWRRVTTQVFRDPSAWYHIVLAFDSTQATAGNRVKLYVNGSQVTAFSTSADPTLNYNSIVNTTIAHSIGSFAAPTRQAYLDGYLTEVNFIDGQALTPSSFGSTNTLTGVWQPAAYTGTYGTNGFELQFTDNSGATATTIGKDFSGNGNNWTPNNISITAGTTYDSMTDVPTLTSATAANFAVLNPLDCDSLSTGSVTNGNLAWAGSYVSKNGHPIRSTFRTPSSGKWYTEARNVTVSGGGNSLPLGFTTSTQPIASASIFAGTINTFIGVDASVFNNNVRFRTTGVSASLADATTLFATYASGDVVNLAIDLSAGKFWAGKNGTWYNSGDPAAGTNATSTFTVGSDAWTFLTEYVSSGDNGNRSSAVLNFGQQGFSNTPPSGFVALNTFNLPTSTIVKGNTVMDATLWAGNNASPRSITNDAAFKPDLVWIKNRSNVQWHNLVDSVRGVNRDLFSNSTNAEALNDTTGTVSAFNTGGFSVSAGTSDSSDVNATGNNYVGWQWQAGQGTNTTNTSGTITSTVSVNASAGFSVVTYTGTGANATVGHGLGVAPQFIIVKDRSVVNSWVVGHSQINGGSSPWNYWLVLNSTQAQTATSSIWNNTAPTSSVFSVGAAGVTNGSAENFVAYCWTPIAGYSAFGSYTGNGSTDGPFVYTGFRPRWVLIKASSTTSQWVLWDTARNTYNVTNSILYPNLSAVEASFSIDILSNGFKFRESGGAGNDSGVTYIYMAFAENPFKNALAR